VIICHPHPRYGGSMHNNVVDSLCLKLVSSEFQALKFNFRGVEGSEGSFDNGRGEQADVRAALMFLTGQPSVDPGRLGLAGYSAGAVWGLKALAGDVQMKGLAAISPPLTLFDFSFLDQIKAPVFLIAGGQDELVPANELHELAGSNQDFCRYRVIDQADHSWYGFESEMSAAVTGFFSDCFNAIK
jgi:alpha/beta superfamily hydrolase